MPRLYPQLLRSRGRLRSMLIIYFCGKLLPKSRISFEMSRFFHGFT